MTVYIDELVRYGNRHWCHMATDGGLMELHELAGRIGLKRAWFQVCSCVPHYDLVPSKRQLAIRYGAVEVSMKELVMKCKPISV